MTAFHDARESGVWWSDPWWENQEHLTDTGLTLEEVRSRIHAIKQLFTPDWVCSAFQAGPPNAVIPVLCGGKGLWPLQDLMWLGRIARKLVEVPTMRRPLAQLIGPKTRAALFEMEVAAWFAEREWIVEFPKEKNDSQTPDIRIERAGVRSAIECKTIEPEAWEEWVQQLSLAILRRLGGPEIPRGVSFDVLLAPRISELNTADPEWQRELAAAIADRIASELMRSGDTASEPLSIPGIADIRFFTVIVRSDFVPLPDLVDVVLSAKHRADPQLLSSTAFVVIVGPIDRPVIWLNPALATNPVSSVLARELKEVFGSGFTSLPSAASQE